MKTVRLLLLLLILAITVALHPVTVLAATSPIATLGLSPATGTFNQGCTVTLNVVLDTKNIETDGTDANLTFDKSIFTVTQVQKGTLYADYPIAQADNTNGKISISGIANLDRGYTGQGTLATVTLTVKSDAPLRSTQINFDFTQNATNDSNVVERGTATDVLGSVTNGSYTIGNSACGSSGSTTASPTPRVSTAPRIGGATGGVDDTDITKGGLPTSSKSATPKKLIDTGSPVSTWVLTVVGSGLAIIGVLGLALL